MKRIVSAILTLTMIFSMFTMVSAETLDVATDFVPNPMELELGVQVLARESGTDNAYSSAGLAVTRPLTEYGVDSRQHLIWRPSEHCLTSSLYQLSLQQTTRQ